MISERIDKAKDYTAAGEQELIKALEQQKSARKVGLACLLQLSAFVCRLLRWVSFCVVSVLGISVGCRHVSAVLCCTTVLMVAAC